MSANFLYIARKLVSVEIGNNMLKSVSIALVFTLLAPEVLAEEMNCSQIENARDRLACFDRFFPRDPSRANVLPDPQPAMKASPSLEEPDMEGVAPASPGTTRKRPRGFLDWPEAEDAEEISSTIAAIRRQDKTRMVFRLENGQIWMQVAPRDLPFQEGDRVTIKVGRIGGMTMRSEGGTSTRVQKIQ